MSTHECSTSLIDNWDNDHWTKALPITALFLFLASLLVAILLKNRKQLCRPPCPLGLPVIGHLHLLRPSAHRPLHELSSRLGPLISLRLGSIPCTVAASPELAEKFLKTHDLSFSSRQHSAAIHRLTYGGCSFAFGPLGPYWKFAKKLCMNEILGPRAISYYRPVRSKELHLFVQLLMKKAVAGEPVNLTEEIMKLTNKFISQMLLGIRSSTEGIAEEARVVVREVTEVLGQFNASDFVWLLGNVDLQGLRRKAEDIHQRFDAFLEKIISGREEERKENACEGTSYDGGLKGFLDILLDVSEDGNSEMMLTRDHIKALLLDFFTAATDTTATAIEWALAELINNSTVLKKAQEEVDMVVGRQRLVEESDGSNLPYIQAIIKETLRIHPPIPVLARKSVQDCSVDGYNIPANTVLFVNIWSIGRNPKYWEDPLDFRPERFLQPGKGDPVDFADVRGHDFKLLPFGTGRRGCPGISLALLEQSTVVATLVQCFDWKVMNSDGVVDMAERPGLSAPRAHDLICFPVARMGQPKILDA